MYKANSFFMDITQLIEKLSQNGVGNALEEYHDKPAWRETKGTVAGSSLLRFLNNLFKFIISKVNYIIRI